ncbi:GntR family transcriptional regulator [Escherichia coli]|nr:GntR family transcriptional regulator [Escherichia coli]GCW70900.1 GntR family transcriptional regulator [Escherichia coli]GCY17718.1 GntR family transcriptional regulator [Escherichia coli]
MTNGISTSPHCLYKSNIVDDVGNDSNLLIVFYVQIMPDDFVMQLHRF